MKNPAICVSLTVVALVVATAVLAWVAFVAAPAVLDYPALHQAVTEAVR